MLPLLDTKFLLACVAIILTLWGFIPYIISILKGFSKPHMFTWIIWGLTVIIVFFAQYSDGGGVGSLPIGLSGILTLGVAVLALYKKSDITINTTDWFFFLLCLSAIPLWMVTSNPVWSVIILTLIDVVAFFPTFRKAYHEPYSEKMSIYCIMTLRNIISAIALEHYSITTLFFPLIISITLTLLILVVFYRRAWYNSSQNA